MYAQNVNNRLQQQMNNDASHHSASLLLEREENAGLEQAVGRKRTALVSAVAQLFLSHAPGGHKSWRKEGTGVVCFVKDRTMRSYVIRFFVPDMSPSGVAAMKEAQYVDDEGTVRKPVTQWALLWEQELYTDIQYMNYLDGMFHMFEAEKAVAGLLFSEPSEAAAFHAAVMDKVSKVSSARQRLATAATAAGEEAESYYSSPTHHHTATTMIRHPPGRPPPARSNSVTNIETADLTPSKKPSVGLPDPNQHLFYDNGQNIAMPNPISFNNNKLATQKTMPVSGSRQRTSGASTRPSILPNARTSDDALYYKPQSKKPTSTKSSSKTKPKLTKADIGQPTNFQHLAHAGFSAKDGEMQIKTSKFLDTAQNDKKLSFLLEKAGFKIVPGVSLDPEIELKLQREIDRLGGYDAVHNAYDQRQQQQQVAYVGTTARQTSTNIGRSVQPMAAPTPPPPYRDLASPLPSREQRATSTTKTVTPPDTPTPPSSVLQQSSRTTAKPMNNDRFAGAMSEVRNGILPQQPPPASMGRSPPIPPRRSGGQKPGAMSGQPAVPSMISAAPAASQPLYSSVPASRPAPLSAGAPPPPPPPPPPPSAPPMPSASTVSSSPSTKTSAAPPATDGRSQLLAQIRGELDDKPKLRPVAAESPSSDKFATLPAKRASGGDNRDDLLKQIRSFGGENKQTLLKPVDPDSVRNAPPIAGAAGVPGNAFDQMAEVLRRVLEERNQAMRGEDSEDDGKSTSDSSEDWND